MQIVNDQKNFERYGEAKYQMVREYGFDNVTFEMCDTNRSWYKLPVDDGDEILYKERERAKREGFEFTNCHGPWCVPWPDTNEEGLLKKIEDTKRAIHNTHVLGSKYCVVHPFLPMSIREINDPEKSQKTWDTNIKILKELVAYARTQDVVICFENMPMLEFSLAKPKDIIRVIEAINDPYLAACFDTGHANIYKELTISDSVHTMAKHTKVMHVHDNFFNIDMHLFPFHGNTKWDEFSQALKEVNYQGIFELETEPKQRLPEHLYSQSMKLLKATADYIIGMAYEK